MKTFIKNGFIRNLRMSLLIFNFVMIYIIHKISVLLKNQLNYFKELLKAFLRSIIDFYFFKKNIFFTTKLWKI